MFRAILLLACLLLAGCATTTTNEPAVQVTVQGIVTHDGAPLEGVRVTFQQGDDRAVSTTGADGHFGFQNGPGACTLRFEADGYQTRSMVLGCQDDEDLAVAMDLVPAVATPPPVVEVEEGDPEPQAKFRLHGTVLDEAQQPMHGALVRIDGTGQQTVGADGAFDFRVVPGTYDLAVSSPCSKAVQSSIDVTDDDVLIGFQLNRITAGAVAAPAIVQGQAGPGPGMAVFEWDAVPDAIAYLVQRGDSAPIHVGSNTVFADHQGDSDEYRVAAIGPCGLQSPWSETFTQVALPGASPTVATRALSTADGSNFRAYPHFDSGFNTTGSTTWRVVTGTGNCCENYVTSDASGRLVDFGGTFLHYSDDEGQTWDTVSTPIPYLTGEGAQVTAPNGDIVAVGWSPYSGDQLWAHKYVAADDQWYYQVMPVHQAFYDRAWVSIVQGPIEINGQLAPYIVQVESNFNGGIAAVLLRSLDGLTYYEPSEPQFSVLESSSQMPVLGHNPDADWVQPISQSPTRPLGPGAGLQLRSGLGTGCSWNLLLADGQYTCPGAPYQELARNTPPYVDSAGNVHVFSLNDDVQYTVHTAEASHTLRVDFPSGWDVRTHDEKVNAQLDTALVALHMSHSDGRTGDFLYRFTNISGEPRLQAIHQVGGADQFSDSGVTGDRRYDFMTVAMLPDGRAVLSFTDEEFHPPALAIEQ